MKTQTQPKKAKIQSQYLACIWCGKDISASKPFAKYCSTHCNYESKGHFIR